MEKNTERFIELAQTVIEALGSDWFDSHIEPIAENLGNIVDEIYSRPDGVYCRYVDGFYSDDGDAADLFAEDRDLIKAALNGNASLESCPHFYNIYNGNTSSEIDDDSAFGEFETLQGALSELKDNADFNEELLELSDFKEVSAKLEEAVIFHSTPAKRKGKGRKASAPAL